MSFTGEDGRAQILTVVAEAADRLAVAIGLLSGAYEMLDDASAEHLEADLFRPVQLAYARLRRTHGEFAARHRMPAREFVPAPEGAPARGLKGLVEGAVGEVLAADGELATLQDSMLPVEVGDAELRAGLQQARAGLGPVPGAARGFLRTRGR